MHSTWLNTLANWNPQLLREFRGRLKLRNVLAAIAISLVVQMLMVMGVQTSLKYPPSNVADVLWQQEKWRDFWETMTWIITYVLYASGTFFLVNDMAQEERSGTMNFVRSSPRPPYQILIGKLLGVPILPYLAIALALPLHGYAGIRAEVPPLVIVSFGILLIAGCILFFLPALLLGLLQNTQQKTIGGQSAGAFAYTFILLFSLVPLYLTWNFQTTWKALSQMKKYGLWTSADHYWGFLPLSQNIWIAHGFTLLNIAIITFFFWRMLLRRFYSHTVPAMSKRLSYALVAYIQILIIGFSLRFDGTYIASSTVSFSLYIANIVLFISLIFALSSSRQAVLDWLRYRQSHHRPSTATPSLSTTALWRDLVWADGSPSIIAIAINLLIVNALVWPWAILVADLIPLLKNLDLATQTTQLGETLFGISLFAVSSIVTILIHATVIQRLFVSRLRNPVVWAAGILLTWIVVPPILLLNLLRLTNSNSVLNAVFWTFWGAPMFLADAANKTGVRTGAIVGLILQVILLVVLLWQLLRQLDRLAATTVKTSDTLVI
jgi:hypothetical protein